jgi:hypothetical protein
MFPPRERVRRSSLNASRPPADAPIPTIRRSFTPGALVLVGNGAAVTVDVLHSPFNRTRFAGWMGDLYHHLSVD